MRCGRSEQQPSTVHRQHSASCAPNTTTTTAATHSACVNSSMNSAAVLHFLDPNNSCCNAAGAGCSSTADPNISCSSSRCGTAMGCGDDTPCGPDVPRLRVRSSCNRRSATALQLLYLVCFCLLLLAVPAVASRDLHSSSSSRSLQQFNNWWSSSASPATAAAAALQRNNQRYQVQLSDLQLPASGGSRSSSRGNRWGRRLAEHSSNLGSGRLLRAAQPGSSGSSSSSVLTSAALQQQVIGAVGGSGGGSSSGSSSTFGGHNANALCSATINYGASVGDASKGATAEVPIFVASFDVVVTDDQQTQQQSSGNSSDWVLGWQFTAGEHIQQDRDVFGDENYAVKLIPEAPAGGAAQGVAVFGPGSFEATNNEVTFNFVGRKGPKGLKPDDAPFRVAPPSHIFLNNHYCWPLLRPSSAVVAAAGPPAAASSTAAAAAAGSSTIHVDVHGKEAVLSTGSDTVEVPVYGLDAVGTAAAGSSNEQLLQQQQQWPEVARPKLGPDQAPHQLMVEYLPVEFADEQPGLFAKTLTQLYFKLSNNQPDSSDPVYLDQITLQYWFHGPQEPPTAASSSSSNGSSAAGSSGSDEGNTDAVAALGASQFRMTCSDATPVIGCSGIAWNVTTGLPNVFGARYVLNIWFPLQQQPSSSGTTMRYMLLPNGSAAASSTGMLQQQQYDSEGRIIYIKPITEIEGIVVINYRRFFASINAQDDYSYLDTPLAPNSTSGSSSSSGSSSDKARPIRRLREANPKMPAYIGTQLAWGSPPQAVKNTAAKSSAAASSSTPQPGSSSTFSYRTYPPGSYCQRSPDGSLVCGVDMLYCCFGSSALSDTAPADWQQRLLAGAIPSSPSGSSSSSGADRAGAVGAAAGGANPPGSSSSGVQGYVIALSVTLPVVALGSALAIFVLLRWAKSEIRRKTSNGSNGSNGDGGSTAPLTRNGPGGNPGVGLLSDRDDSSGTGVSNHSWESSPGGRGVSKPSRFVRALLSPSSAEPVVGLLDHVQTAAAASSSGSSSSSWRKLGLLLCCKGAAADGDNRLGQLGHGRNDTAMMPGDIPHHGSTAAAAAAGSSIPQQQHGKDVKAIQLSTIAADLEPVDDGDIAAVITARTNSPWQPPPLQQQQQPESSVLTPEQLAYVYNTNPQQALVWGLRHRGRTLPDGVLIRALQQVALWQQQQQQGPNQQQPSEAGGTNNSSSSNLVRSSSSSSFASVASEDDAHSKRHATWNGRLNADAFGEDILGHLINLQLDRDLMKPQNSGPTNPSLNPQAVNRLGSIDDLTSDLAAVQSGQVLPGSTATAGAAAAAVEAAIAAINAAITGSSSSSSAAARYLQQQQQGLPKSPRQQNPTQTLGALIPSPPSTTDPQNPAPSFYKALMATGGVLKPPGGPPIPLNVDYVKEIQPYLGRLVGKGGFGHVYEGLWRGRKVAVKLLTVDTDEPAVLDAFLKEVALCACLRGCDRIVKLLGACLGGVGDGSSDPAAAAGCDPTAAGSSSSSLDHSMIRAAAGSPSPFSYEHQMPTTVAATTADDGHQQQQGQQQQQMALIMELMEGGNLAQRIYHPSKRRLTYLEILQIALDITTGLAYLHPAVVHRDLKPQNVLLDRQSRAAIADFGISRFKDPHRSYLSVTHQGGTPNYMAPELFNGTRVDEAADVYSLGCILYECLARKQPFGHLASEAKSFNVLFKIIVAVAINKERPPLPADTPPRLASLINRCWLEDPAQRPRVAELAAELRDMIQEELSSHAEELGRIRRLSTRSRSISLASHSSSNSLAQLQQQQQQSRGDSSNRGLLKAKSESAAQFRAYFDNAAAVRADTAAGSDASADSSDQDHDDHVITVPSRDLSAAAAAAVAQERSYEQVGLWSAATSFKSINSFRQISPQKLAAAAAAAATAAGSSSSSSDEGAGGVATPPPNSPPAPATACKLLHALLPWSKCPHPKCSVLMLQEQERRHSCSDIEAPEVAAAAAAAAAAAVVEGSAHSCSSGGSAGSRYNGVVDWIMRKVSSSSNTSSSSQQDHGSVLPITAADGLAAAAGSSIVVSKPTVSTGPPTPARVQDRRPSLALSAISDLGPHGSSSGSVSSSGPMFPDHRMLIRSKSSGLPDHSSGSPMFKDQGKQMIRAQSAGADHALLLWQRQQQQYQAVVGSSTVHQDVEIGPLSVLPAVYSRSSSSAQPVLDSEPSTALYATAGSLLGSSTSRLGRMAPAGFQQQQQQQGLAADPASAAADQGWTAADDVYASASSNIGSDDQIRSRDAASSSSSSPQGNIEGSISMRRLPNAATPFSAAAAAAVPHCPPETNPPVHSAAAAVQRKVSFAVLPEVLGEV